MKKLILLLILCLPFQASAWNPMTVMSGSSGSEEASVACAACPSAVDEANTVCEDFDGSGSTCTWTESIDGGPNSVDDDHSHGGTYACNDAGDYDALFTMTDETEDCYIWWDGNWWHGGVDDARFDFRLVSHTFDASGEAGTFFTLMQQDSTILRIYLRYDGSKMTLYTYYYDDVAGISTVTGNYEIVVGTWYTVTVVYQQNTSIIVTIDTIAGSSPDTEADVSDVGDRAVTKAAVGYVAAWHQGLEAGDDISFEVDRIKVDNDGIPSKCGT